MASLRAITIQLQVWCVQLTSTMEKCVVVHGGPELTCTKGKTFNINQLCHKLRNDDINTKLQAIKVIGNISPEFKLCCKIIQNNYFWIVILQKNYVLLKNFSSLSKSVCRDVEMIIHCTVRLQIVIRQSHCPQLPLYIHTSPAPLKLGEITKPKQEGELCRAQ